MKLGHLKSLCVAGALAAVVSTPAHAVVTSWDWQGCGSGKFITCASVHIEIVGTQVVLRVDNYGAWNPNTNTNVGDPSVFAELGLSGLGGGGSLASLASFPCTGGTAGTDPDCGWVFSSDLTNLSNLSGAPFAGGDATPPPSQNGLNAGANGTFYRVTLTFNTTGTVNDLTNVVFGLHAVAGPNNCSTKFQVARTGTNTGTVSSTDQPDPLCDDGSPPTEITPEPMTLTLMATGLVGLAGVGAIRRRRKV